MQSVDAPFKDFNPVTRPLETLEQLQTWTPTSSIDNPFNVASISFHDNFKIEHEGSAFVAKEHGFNFPLSPAVYGASSSKLLVCHDMEGGYKEDSETQGGHLGNAFRIWSWQLIDIFVYFSHHLVTIPPPCWTDAAHIHGVKVLGTFITEWEQGEKICTSAFASPASSRLYASQLANIAKYFGFDGWLINIENNLVEALIPNLLIFLRHLQQEMHELVPNSQVIWYDSITTAGTLLWQNALTDLNKAFFDASDGIFVNYTWKETSPAKCALAAGARASDVYMGIDAFGRGTFGGGGFHCDVALTAAAAVGLSAAIFAPGWPYETLQRPDFEETNNKFWELIGAAWHLARPSFTRLPFATFFDQGVGQALYREGQLLSALPWNNLSFQSLQPLRHVADVQMPSGSSMHAAISFAMAYEGGACIELSGSVQPRDTVKLELFRPMVQLPPAGTLVLQFMYKSETGSVLSLVFHMEREDASPVEVLLGALPDIFHLPTGSNLTASDKPIFGPVMLLEGSIELVEDPQCEPLAAGAAGPDSKEVETEAACQKQGQSAWRRVTGLLDLDLSGVRFLKGVSTLSVRKSASRVSREVPASLCEGDGNEQGALKRGETCGGGDDDNNALEDGSQAPLAYQAFLGSLSIYKACNCPSGSPVTHAKVALLGWRDEVWARQEEGKWILSLTLFWQGEEGTRGSCSLASGGSDTQVSCEACSPIRYSVYALMPRGSGSSREISRESIASRETEGIVEQLLPLDLSPRQVPGDVELDGQSSARQDNGNHGVWLEGDQLWHWVGDSTLPLFRVRQLEVCASEFVKLGVRAMVASGKWLSIGSSTVTMKVPT